MVLGMVVWKKPYRLMPGAGTGNKGVFMDREIIISRVLNDKLIAILRGTEKDTVLPLVEAICAGGIRMVEVTFNQSDPDSFAITAESIRSIGEHFSDDVYVGAGTVLTAGQLRMAVDAGARYIISPSVDLEIIRETRRLGLVSIPGTLTPSECVAAANAGADFIKLFPISCMGPAYLTALRAPLSHLKFLGVGGIEIGNIKDYLAAGAVGFGIGGKLVNKEWIKAKAFAKITQLAEEYTKLIGGLK
jgi:2-dehydro-3-deoxyphosphogluconate aldolase/(4S)-4-hydroxy-2-oxoglutarate aldolase